MNFKGYTILIAEDLYSNYDYMVNVLEGTNIRILHAPDGQCAVEMVRTNDDIDLVLMDIVMPVKDGNEATSEIKTMRPDLPVIAQTAYALETDVRNFMRYGYDDYIVKPFPVMKLLSIIAKHVKAKVESSS